jgi:Uncharacterized alpha/beta hydrolase domain (DUF2235)
MTERVPRAGNDDVVPGRPRQVDAQGNHIQADGVPIARATAADLQASTAANGQLGQMQVPVLVSRDRPNERLFVAVLDGTGNDMDNPKMGSPTGVSRVHEQIRDQHRSGQLPNVFSSYLAGPGTGSHWLDAAQGHTFKERSETMYQRFIEQSARWLAENPKADIRVAAMGFSRGAEQAAYFTRLVDERGIQDPSGAQYTRDSDGLVTSVRYTKPPLVAPGQVAQAALLDDPVATGDPRNYDRRLPPSVVSALQITARDETRDQFIGSVHLPRGFSDGNRALNLNVPGAHSNIGDGYFANGLGIRNTNLGMQYLNGLVDNGKPLLSMRPEPPLGHPSNVIHDSEQHRSLIYTRMGFDRDGVRDENTQLAAPRYGSAGPRGGVYQLPTKPEERVREPMDPGLAGKFEYRALPIAPAPSFGPRRAEAVDNPDHRGHPLFQQALDGLRKEPNIGGKLTEEQQSRVAAALTAGALEGRDPLRRIDAVVLNRQGDGLIAMEGGLGDPAGKLKVVPLAQALNTPVQDSSQKVDAALQDSARNPQQSVPMQPEPLKAAGQAR